MLWNKKPNQPTKQTPLPVLSKYFVIRAPTWGCFLISPAGDFLIWTMTITTENQCPQVTRCLRAISAISDNDFFFPQKNLLGRWNNNIINELFTGLLYLPVECPNW